MSEQKTVGLLFGGESPEHEVSIATARSIHANLDPKAFQVQPIGVAKNGVWVFDRAFERLSRGELPERSASPFLPVEKGWESAPLPDVFLIAIHGAGGEDGQLQSYLELLNRPYTGAGRLALAAGMDKWMARSIWQSHGLPMVEAQGVTEAEWRQEPDRVLANLKQLPWPRFVKPANLGSSIGISKVKTADLLPQAIEHAFTFDRRILIEAGADAREIEVAVLGGEELVVSVPGEVLVADEFYTFEDKYVAGRSSMVVPAAIPPAIAAEVRTLAERAFRALDGYGMARVDFFLDRRSAQLYLNEINFIPGFTTRSMYPCLLQASGIPYDTLLAKLIELAFHRHQRDAARTKLFSSGSSWFKGAASAG